MILRMRNARACCRAIRTRMPRPPRARNPSEHCMRGLAMLCHRNAKSRIRQFRGPARRARPRLDRRSAAPEEVLSSGDDRETPTRRACAAALRLAPVEQAGSDPASTVWSPGATDFARKTTGRPNGGPSRGLRPSRGGMGSDVPARVANRLTFWHNSTSGAVIDLLGVSGIRQDLPTAPRHPSGYPQGASAGTEGAPRQSELTLRSTRLSLPMPA